MNCRLVERDASTILNKGKQYKVRNNLSKQQWKDLKTIKKDESLVIQAADKGGAIVILDREAYDKEIHNQLSNSKFYRKLEQNPIVPFKKST